MPEHFRLTDGDGCGGAAIGEHVERTAGNEQRSRRGQAGRGGAKAREIIAIRQSDAIVARSGGRKRRNSDSMAWSVATAIRPSSQGDAAAGACSLRRFCVVPSPLAGVDSALILAIQSGIPDGIP